VPEVPLVLDSAVEKIQKTKEAVKVLQAIGGYTDVEKARDSKKLRRGVGKMRNRRHVQRRGPLVVYAEDGGIRQAFRNLPGVELASVDRLNLLQLAPGGHLGRFIIWTRAAFAKLNSIYGSLTRVSNVKKGWTVPRNIMFNSDVTRLINSDEVQSKVRAPIKGVKRVTRKKNPLTNLGALVKLNPYALSARRSEVLAEKRRAVAKATKLQAIREKKAVPETKTEQKAKALARTHEPQQRENYKRLVLGDQYERSEEFAIKVQKPRPSIKGVFPKSTEKKQKVRKVREKKVEAKEEKKTIVIPAKMLKAPKVKVVKIKKEAKPKKEAKGKGGKEEKGKEEAKKAGGKEEKGKEEAKKAGGKGKGK